MENLSYQSLSDRLLPGINQRKTVSVFATFQKLYEILDERERRNAAMVFLILLGMGMFELLGVASIMPFMAVLSDPDVVERNYYLSTVFDILGFDKTHDFLIFLGVGTFIVVVANLAYKAFANWVMARYINMRLYSMSSRLLRIYLRRPYTFFLNRHSSDLGKSVLSEVRLVISQSLQPAMELVANSILAIFLIGLVVFVNPVVALSATVFLGGTYTIIYLAFRRYLSRIGARRVKTNQQRFHVVQEALGGIKDVKVLGLEEGYIRGFRKPSLRYAQVRTHAAVIGKIPQFALQALVFGGMLLILLSMLVEGENRLGTILPLMTMYAVAASRLIPALQNIYKSMTSLRFGSPALETLHADFHEAGPATSRKPAAEGSSSEERVEPIQLKREIRLKDVYYTYPGAQSPALTGISLAIPAKTTVGFVGRTGAGKTTIVDVILGLLEPQRGQLFVDDMVIDSETIPAWQQDIGYVPQHIYLTDDTVAANIAFGESERDVDRQVVEKAARTAELHQFVMEELPDGYDTTVGERGVRLSGGQRQRIGIARALYRDPDVLVFDEATSALDTVTEGVIMDAVKKLSDQKTIIMIAHRLSTVRGCHNIFLLEHGKLVDYGTYEELLETNGDFKAMVTG